jgi:hypothetical protein
MPCPRKFCTGTATFGIYVVTEGDDVAFVHDDSGRGPINEAQEKEVWHCPSCGTFFYDAPK